MTAHSPTGSLAGKIALVTGAGRGPGKAIALRLGREGARVAVVDLNPEAAEATAREIADAGGEAVVWVADVSSKRPVQNMIDEVIERWARIDMLVNAAGVEPSASILRMDEWAWERTIAVNLKAAFLMCQNVGRMMQTAGGAIVNVVSLPAGAQPDRAAVFASQVGLIGFTRACALEFEPFRIRVNAVCPIDSGSDDAFDRWFDRRLAMPLDEAVAFLCSDAAGLTGQVIGSYPLAEV